MATGNWTIPVTCVWDPENASLPDGYVIATLKGNIQTALRHKLPGAYVDKIIAVAPDNAKHEEIVNCADITFVPLQSENIRCEDECKKLVVWNEDIHDKERNERKTDRADLYAIKEIFMTALKLRQYILVIAGDKDFLSTIKGLIGQHKFVMIALLENSSKELYDAGKCIWLWKSNDAKKSTMVRGGAPINRKKKEKN